MKRRTLPWILLVGALLAALAFGGYTHLERVEQRELFDLEQSIGAVVNTVSALAEPVLSQAEPTVEQIRALELALKETQARTSVRLRVLGPDRTLVADSLGHPSAKEQQAYLRFRPEIGKAFQGQYGAYTRLSDVNARSLALFVAEPVRSGDDVIGVVYGSRSTDGILFRLGQLRRQLQYWFFGITLLLFIATLLVTGRFSVRLQQLGHLADQVGQAPGGEKLDDMDRIGRGLEKLVEDLRDKVAELQDEKVRTRRFVEEIAHELKTPVTALQGSVEALRESPDEKLLDNVARETERLSVLVGLLIELQKLEYYEMQWQTFELISLLETVLESFRFKGEKKQLKLLLEGPEEVLARGDPDKLRRVLENLLDNAIRCSPAGKTITLSVSPGESVHHVSVADQGPGIPIQEAGRVFVRGEGGNTVDTMGLGLSVASEIVARHGETLTFESPEEGTVFRFGIPAYQA